MRRFSILILFLASAVPLQASYEARTPHYSVAIDVVPLAGASVRYDLRITDVVTGEVLATPQLTAMPGQLLEETSVTVRDLTIRIRLSSSPGYRFGAEVSFEKGDEIVDSILSYWSSGPRKKLTARYGDALRVGGDVKAPIVINRVEPSFTDEARKARISGIVILEVVIGRDGLVKTAEVLKPLPFGLDQAAVDAVKQWTFKPGTLNGQPVDVIFNLTVNFKIQTPPPPPPD
jgi:TonB family protein